MTNLLNLENLSVDSVVASIRVYVPEGCSFGGVKVDLASVAYRALKADPSADHSDPKEFGSEWKLVRDFVKGHKRAIATKIGAVSVSVVPRAKGEPRVCKGSIVLW